MTLCGSTHKEHAKTGSGLNWTD